jgi:hypothetical protein
MLTVFFESRVVVHYEYAQQGQNVNKGYYLEVMLCGARDRTCGRRERCSCIMTTHQLIPHNWFKLSWPNTTFLRLDKLPTLPTWLLAIFYCSPTLKRSWKRLALSHETAWYGTRRPGCTPFAKRHSRIASKDGGTAGRSVFSYKDTTSTGIRIADLQACKCIFPEQRSDTFWTAHVFLGSLINAYELRLCIFNVSKQASTFQQDTFYTYFGYPLRSVKKEVNISKWKWRP